MCFAASQIYSGNDIFLVPFNERVCSNKLRYTGLHQGKVKGPYSTLWSIESVSFSGRQNLVPFNKGFIACIKGCVAMKSSKKVQLENSSKN